MIDTLLLGCSFTDPIWQKDIPWSVHYSHHRPSYIVAKAGMGIHGICKEALNYLPSLTGISTAIIMLPTIWRLDMEFDVEANPCTAMVDLLEVKNGIFTIKKNAERKWLCQNDPSSTFEHDYKSYMNKTYKIMGLGNVALRSLMSLEHLILYCKNRNIKLYITAITDPMKYLEGIDYMPYIHDWLHRVDYSKWLRFNNCFVDDFLKHNRHPNSIEHKLLAEHLVSEIKKFEN